MYREKALVKLKSPEQIDEALKIGHRKNRLALAAFGGVALFALLWGILGRLPETGRGQGILVTLNSVLPVQSQADGQIASWLVTVGDRVEKGQVLGILSQPEIERQLQQAQAKLDEVLARNEVVQELRARFNSLERKALERKQTALEDRIAYLEGYIGRTRSTAAEINEQNREALAQRRKNLAAAIETQQQLIAALDERYQSYRRLRADNLMSQDNVNNSRRRLDDARLKLSELELQNQEFELQQVELDEAFLNANSQISDREHSLTQLNLQLRELENQRTQLDKQQSEDDFRDRNEVNELRREIDRLQKRLQRDREVTAEFAGRVLELTAAEGAVVNTGQRLLQLDARREDSELVALAYFKDEIGKRLEPGMPVRVSPSTVSQKRYGNIRGQVLTVSEYPVTEEAATNYIGNTEVARKLLVGDHNIEVVARLTRDDDTPSGFAWTSQLGPDTEVTAGTTADVWVTHERRPPLSYIPPVLREWTGL